MNDYLQYWEIFTTIDNFGIGDFGDLAELVLLVFAKQRVYHGILKFLGVNTLKTAIANQIHSNIISTLCHVAKWESALRIVCQKLSQLWKENFMT